MTVPIERTMKVLAVVVTIAFSAIFATAVVSAAPNAIEETPVNDTAPNEDNDFGLLVLRGTVTSVDENSLTASGEDNQAFVAVFDEYAIFFDVVTQSQAALADVIVGDRIEVVGQENADGEINTDFTSILPDGQSVRGKVAELLGTTIIVSSDAADYAITTDDDTVFFLDSEPAVLSDIMVDMSLTAYGEITDEGAVDTNLVIAHKGTVTGPIEVDISDLGRQRDESETVEVEPAMPPSGSYSVGRTRDAEISVVSEAVPPGGYSVGRTRDP